jgi:hypothetical protein
MKKSIIAVLVVTMSVLFGATAQEEKDHGTSVETPVARAVEFGGYSLVARERLFVLYDVDAKESSLWIRLGQTWRGHTLISFDPKMEKLTLRKEEQDVILGLQNSKIQRAILFPGLIRGTYTLLDGTVIYSPDAQLKVGTGTLISSPTGLMVSDEEQEIIGGDLAIETEKATVEAQDALINVRRGKMTAKRVKFIPKSASNVTEGPNKSPEPTPTAVTPRAGEGKSK